MPNIDMAALVTEIVKYVKVKSIHSACLILALSLIPFLLYYSTMLKLRDIDFQFILSAVSLTTAFCIFIYVCARVMIWMSYAVVIPGIVRLIYIAVHSLAWLLRTIIVPSVVWLLCIASPVVARLLYAAVFSLTRWLQDIGFRSSRAFGNLIAGARAYPGPSQRAGRPQGGA